MAGKPKKVIPETLQQARRWETMKEKYIRAEFCDPCAAQAAWGHQIGFSQIHPPCPDCTDLPAPVDTLNVGKWLTAA